MRQAAEREAMENEDEKSEDIGLLFSYNIWRHSQISIIM